MNEDLLHRKSPFVRPDLTPHFSPLHLPGPVHQISSRTSRPDPGTSRVVRSTTMRLHVRAGALADETLDHLH